jgi:hypothetical protein
MTVVTVRRERRWTSAAATPARKLVRFTRWQQKSVVSRNEKRSLDFPASGRAAPLPLKGAFEVNLTFPVSNVS